MQTSINFNENWAFKKDAHRIPKKVPASWERVNLPHTWNNIDGQDGGGDYFRGECIYCKQLNKSDFPKSDRYRLEILAANSIAQVYVNGKLAAKHNGGYAAWIADLTEYLEDENVIAIKVDNSNNLAVYPQMADFTFYGGLYRGVNLICIRSPYFDRVSEFGPDQLFMNCIPDESYAAVGIRTNILGNLKGCTVIYEIKDMQGNTVVQKTQTEYEQVTALELDNPCLWDGLENPYLYTLEVKILRRGTVIDSVSKRFGVRTFEIDPEEGFILNGRPYQLRGVSRHQDRLGKGNALSPEDHLEDMDLICEMGANAIRLAHYQHDQYFYDLCDERGIIVWAEIPYISAHENAAWANSVRQMGELIMQNSHHPSIAVWGLSNEITINEGNRDILLFNHKTLNLYAHNNDPTRLTTVAAVSSCDINHPYLDIPDVIAYNHYFGWYGGDVHDNGPWFDNFHKEKPGKAIGISEYGAEALNWHSSNPQQGDYTEEYQAYYHEEMIKQLYTRPWIWGCFVWNMFDFGADSRDEGGEPGQNHKGLVTFDRKYKKDAFYAYKAWLSKEPFVHICSKRYINRNEDETPVTVYSNLPEVELFVNGESVAKMACEDHFFHFRIKNVGESEIVAVAGDCKDIAHIRKVDEPDMSYVCTSKNDVFNWFDITSPEGYYSFYDTVGDLMANTKAKAVLLELFQAIVSNNENKTGTDISNSSIMNVINSYTLIRIISIVKTGLSREQLLDFNRRLNEIHK